MYFLLAVFSDEIILLFSNSVQFNLEKNKGIRLIPLSLSVPPLPGTTCIFYCLDIYIQYTGLFV